MNTIPNHIPIFDSEFHRKRNKDKEYQERISWITESIKIQFLKYDFLSKIYDHNFKPFKVTYGDQSDLGKLFVGSLSFDKWLTSLDKMKDKSLEKYINSLERRISLFITKSAQQVDAPEPATMVSSALHTSHRPAR